MPLWSNLMKHYGMKFDGEGKSRTVQQLDCAMQQMIRKLNSDEFNDEFGSVEPKGKSERNSNEKRESDIGEESSAHTRSSNSSSEYSEMIKIRCGNLDILVSPGVLDDLKERSKKGEGDMEVLLSKYMMEEIQKAIKTKTEAMVDSCRLEAEFAKEVNNKMKNLTKLTKEAEQSDQEDPKKEKENVETTSVVPEIMKVQPVEREVNTGVLKPIEERDYVVPQPENKMENQKVNQKPANIKNESAKTNGTTGVRENVNKGPGMEKGNNMNIFNNLGKGGGPVKGFGEGQRNTQSYASLLASGNSNGRVEGTAFAAIVQPEIKEKNPEVHRGLPAIRFEECGIKQLNAIEDHLLIGKFSWGRPNLEDIRRWKKSQLG
ncbi:uncharacterized protein LOC115998000 isoform X2 [Ipomoea triloba]|uniref:uncharacterized protein LOC115998000 isoform X2 n=1 Tax=Ipomoea triloba TaxID=35885 RepID=UPI00125D4239|nr:uncharacterized protein LOC115998000 isoform X2 [Ipomoea triloba]